MIRRLLPVLVVGAVLAAPAGGAGRPPSALHVAADRAFPGATLVRLCLTGDRYAYAHVRSGGRDRFAVFIFVPGRGYQRTQMRAAVVRRYCERLFPTALRTCGWEFGGNNVDHTWSRAARLPITASDGAGLRTAYLRCHAYDDQGPVTGSVYLARYAGYEWAIGTFTGPGDQPETFVRPVGQTEWADQGETGGELCEDRIPLAVLRAWRFTHQSRVGAAPGFRCYLQA